MIIVNELSKNLFFFKTHNNIVSIKGLSNQWKKKQSFLGGNGAIAKLFVKPV